MSDELRGRGLERPGKFEVSIDRRVTTLEVQFGDMGKRMDGHIEATNRLLTRLDERADRQDVNMARLLGGLVVAQFLAIMFAPVLRQALGLP